MKLLLVMKGMFLGGITASFVILCAGPTFHHEPQDDGVFVPGLAPGTIRGLDMISPKPTLASLPTMAYEKKNSAVSVGSTLPSPPTPKRLEMTLTPVSRIPPDNQLGLTPNSSPTATTTIDPPTPHTDPAGEVEQTQQDQPPVPPNQPDLPTPPAPAGVGSGSLTAPPTNQAPATASVGPAVAPRAADATTPPDKADVVIQGTMYTDGTYWKKRVCT